MKPGSLAHKALGTQGFTMLELLVVIGIMILMTVVTLSFARDTWQAKVKDDAVIDMGIISASTRAYSEEKGSLPSSLDDLIASGYVKRIGVDTSHIIYQRNGYYITMSSSIVKDTVFIIPSKLISDSGTY